MRRKDGLALNPKALVEWQSDGCFLCQHTDGFMWGSGLLPLEQAFNT